MDVEFKNLQDDRSDFKPGIFVGVEKKNSSSLSRTYDSRSRELSNDLKKLEEERNEISAAERESNETQNQTARKVEIDQAIEGIRNKQSSLNQERALAKRLIESASSMEPTGEWIEMERTENTAFFIRLRGAYTVRPQELANEEILSRVSDLEFVRAEKGRDLMVEELIGRGLAEAEAN